MASMSPCAIAWIRWPAAASRWQPLLGLAICLLAFDGHAQPEPSARLVEDGRCQLQRGRLRLAHAQFEAGYRLAPPGEARARAAAALGESSLRLNQLAQAEAMLTQAEAESATPRERAAAALALGNVHLARRQPVVAERDYARALALAPHDHELALTVELNRLRNPQAARRLERLLAAGREVDTLAPGAEHARLALNIAAQAASLSADGLALAVRQYDAGRASALAAGHDGLAAEAYDGLAALYERQARDTESLRLNERGLWHAQRADESERMISLEWRTARLMLRAGHDELALAAFQRTVAHIEDVRADIPVEYADGKSSFRQTLEPVYLGLTDLLIKRSASQDGAGARAALLRSARNAIELIKQTELEDYLRDRCGVSAARREQVFLPPPATAIVYPIIFPDRLELLVETAQGIEGQRVEVTGEQLRRTALNFATALRNAGEFRTPAQALYRWMIAPIDARLAEQGIQTLVVVPDGVLRLVPMAALHDGERFLIQRYAIGTAPGLSMVTGLGNTGQAAQALLAGLSRPGPVVVKLSSTLLASVLPLSRDVATKVKPDDPAANQARVEALRDALSLPGVRQEIDDIARVTQNTTLIDESFTLSAFRQALLARDHAIVHIASHGVFGSSAETSFIMSYDELLTLDGLQELLNASRGRRAPIELITLSACQSAEGDDRAPLGMSGTAIRARARSALGTLWPVTDEAAGELMPRFYRMLLDGTHSRAGALREAQLQVLGNPAMQHPFFWAPFVMVGDWQ